MVNKLVLGTVQLGIPYGINNQSGQPDKEQASAILGLAQSAGIETLDTAKAYGNAIEVIGDFHHSSGTAFKVISKFHGDHENMSGTVKDDLAVLNIKQFEAYLFHSFSDFETVSVATLHALQQLKENQLVKKIGVSVYGNDQFEKAINSKHVELIQLPFNLLDNMSQRGSLLKKAKDLGKEIHIRSVFLQGLFMMEEVLIPSKISSLKPYLAKIKELAASEKLSMQELALAYVMQNQCIDKVLLGVDSVEQLRVNLEAVNKMNTLSAAAIAQIDAISVAERNFLNPSGWA